MKALEFDRKYIIMPLFIVLGIFLAVASRVLLPDQINSFWCVLAEVLGYGFIAAGIGMFGSLSKPTE